MAFKFENLAVWQRSLELCGEINDLARQFPPYEQFSLCHQIRKAADSINLNIAEGCTGQTNIEFARFLGYSLRSCVEVISCLFIAKRKEYIDQERFAYFYKRVGDPCAYDYQAKRQPQITRMPCTISGNLPLPSQQ